MVPCVTVCDARAVGDASNLVAVVPPSHDARILRSVRINPLVPSVIIVDDNLLSRPEFRLPHDLGLRELLRKRFGVPQRVFDVGLREVEARKYKIGRARSPDKAQSRDLRLVYLVLARVANGARWDCFEAERLEPTLQRSDTARAVLLLMFTERPRVVQLLGCVRRCFA